MENEDEKRAKQFLPFDALDGLSEALHKKEVENEIKLELSEEQIEKISQDILSLNDKENIEVEYYNGKRYVKIKGILDRIDFVRKKLIISDKKINFSDIINIESYN